MVRVFTIVVVIFGLLLSANHAKAGTLDRGATIGPFFVAGGSPTNPVIAQLKYQMAIDAKLGLKNVYTTVVNYNNCTFDSHDNFLDISNTGSGSVSVDNTFDNTYETNNNYY